MFSTLLKKITPKNLIFVFAVLLFFSCQKEISGDGGSSVVVTPPDLSTKVNSSVSGFVTDENDAAVIGATVQFGTANITTDKYGYFEAKNVQVVKVAAVVTVIKPGYFKGIKTYITAAGKSAFFRIKLIPKTNIGNITATAGGTVSLPNGLSITFPAGAIVNATTNLAYTGTVNVAAFWINPEASDLNKIMPGDLRGIDGQGAFKTLQTFGMAAVELTGTAGELLQIVNGKTATLKLAIPASLAANAPATIPLWYFDETNGLWKEQGTATKTGSSYVGEVSHFSYWNYDVPANYVQFNCTLVNQSNQPLQHALVKITVVGTGAVGFGYTDSTGYTGGAVPNNAQLRMDVYANNICSTILYSQTFTTTTTNVSLGSITINASPVTANISGTVTTCANAPVTHGFVIVKINNEYFRSTIANGNFNYNITLCSAPIAASIIVEDSINQQQSTFNNITLNAGNNNQGNIQACGNTTQEYVNYTINGSPVSITPSNGTVMQAFDSSQANPIILSANKTTPTATINFGISRTNIAPGSIQNLTFFSNDVTGSTTIPVPINVNITEYGAINQFIAGTFSGTVNSINPPNTAYTITCSFRVRRNN